MHFSVKNVVQECSEVSDKEQLTFPQVVMKLMEAGVERYHADLVRAEKTYYMPNGESHVVKNADMEKQPAQDFSADQIKAAIKAIQTQTIGYKEFCKRIASAGCVGYLVSLIGRRAVYFGRTGDSYIEPFPVAK